MADENNKNEKELTEEQRMSRRRFIKNSGLAAGGLVVGGVAGGLIPWGGTKHDNKTQNAAQKETRKDYNHALMFFTQAEFKTVEAAVERIFPTDENGPGAKDLGVGYYIDHQLAGSWGFNARDYMQPPFYHGEKSQGYQGRMRRREIFRIGLKEMQNYSQSKYKKNFEDLTEDQQDKVLKDFEGDKVNLTTISPSGFFDMLRSSVLEGAYSDPLYGGNKDMAGWSMREYPGDQMGYTNIIDKDFQKIKPQSLQDHM
ncbi:gluconate 2-dehydrogenase gamma chain [Pullulanibacillus pueri]|uniref:Oxidoreductase n=1 Tax=Pullulanibacillus pueri TaxID=1437324 RepID=A0A8J3EL37_9BACL|nr:gluconate 2-dehydrogenase subunit 3 family protein [Pullulanibacillus pueri]MBM7681253.1 gluconate 2-dehydrogenase gamma chain [Pullulanibacillus pueri]GGH77871.1 oxidoreductase [Pullulanibacillus pueri]